MDQSFIEKIIQPEILVIIVGSAIPGFYAFVKTLQKDKEAKQDKSIDNRADAYEQLYNEATDRIKKVESRVTSLEDELKILNQANSDLKAQNKQLTEINLRLTDQNIQLKRENATLKKQNHALLKWLEEKKLSPPAMVEDLEVSQNG